MKEDDNIAYQNLLDTVNPMLRGKFIIISVYIEVGMESNNKPNSTYQGYK